LRDKPDVVLLDVNMPTLSGDTIAKILGRVSQNMDTLILLHSRLSIDSLRLEAIATGAHGYIQKTDSATELVRRIEYWINRSRYATSSKRLEAAPAAGNTGDGETRSSSRFAVASNVGRTIGAAGAANSATMEPLAAASSGSNRTAFSSTRLRAATAAMTGPPGAASSSGSMPAVTATRGSLTARPLVTDSAPPPGSTATSRNMRAVKSAVAGGNRPAKVLFVDDDWKMLSSYRTMVAGYLVRFEQRRRLQPPSCRCPAAGRRLRRGDARFIGRRYLSPRGTSGPTLGESLRFVTGAASTPAVAEFLNTLDVRVFHKPVATERLLDTIKQMTEVQRR
jgi:CheY-like chemotaxis protein